MNRTRKLDVLISDKLHERCVVGRLLDSFRMQSMYAILATYDSRSLTFGVRDGEKS
jgi:hypothetical protein